MVLRHVLIWPTAILLAVIAGREATLTWSSSHRAMPPLSMGEADPRIRVARSETAITQPDRLARDASRIGADARALLSRSPLNAPALRQLSMIEQGADPRKGEALAKLAGRVTRRDLATEIMLIEYAVEAEDLGQVLGHYDHALSVHPEIGKALLPILWSALDKEDIRDGLAGFAGRRWFGPFLSGALPAGADARSVVYLAQAAARRQAAKPRGAMALRLANQALAREDYGAARQLIALAPGYRPGALDNLDFVAETDADRLGRLGWVLKSSPTLDVRRSGESGIELSVSPERKAVAAERVTLLAPGRYVLSMTASAEDGRPLPALEWSLSCAASKPGKPFWTHRWVAGDAGVLPALTIPSSCPAQNWRLSVDSGVSLSESTVRIAAVRIRKEADGR